MRRMFVIPVVLFLFAMQANNFLFANEDAEAKAKVSAVATEAKAKVSAVATEAKAEVSAATTKAKAEVSTVATEAKEEVTAVATEAKAEVTAVATEAKAKVSAVTTEAKAEESTETVVEAESDVIATINGEEISRLEFDRRLNVFRRMNQDVTNVVKMQVVDQLTKKVLLKQFVDKKRYKC